MDDTQKEFIINGRAVIGRAQYQTLVNSGGHAIIADEPLDEGGTNTGMSPYNLLLASLASCTVITLRIYINRKMWAIDEVAVDLQMYRTGNGILIDSAISFKGEVTQEQQKRLVAIADACPIHKILVGNITITTSIGQKA
ncbi:OsmC family protein [Mucilaginibacter psychrotolerans]|uniref:OsmC family peroxiredoxin n=1 Tax=Mucilaginibacter psychrotolerans TaxID=1524096 RepID=A0A4Y8S8I5_9SPHI|nr:OsmC family protein [Mucilaginibacter psychrotolerans]TFF34930.1 OsmC family peroxiredoxin [Mucilaginibacter psychrotolerans]